LSGISFTNPLRRELGNEQFERYFYHVAPFAKLDSVKRLGLTTPMHHGMGNWGSVTEGVTDRLFLYSGERIAIGWIDSVPNGVLLRFTRELIDGKTRYHDHNFAQNETHFGRRPELIFSFCVDATVPPESLEGCVYVKREPGQDMWSAPDWISLSEVKAPTKALVRGQFVDRVDAGLPRAKFEEHPSGKRSRGRHPRYSQW
jgi:hypothetical protein